MSKLVTIYGGSGFVGLYIARAMAKAGWRVRVAVRRPNEAGFVKTYGVVGQVEPILCNIRNDASVAAAMAGADAVVNCVGTFETWGKNDCEAVQADGAARIARAASDAGIDRFVHISAIGADVEGPSEYIQTKGQGEAAVLAHVPSAAIVRPSIIFGAEDQFFNRFAGMARLSPMIPLIGADTKFQPVHVQDVAEAVSKIVLGQAPAAIYELGGPEAASFRDLMQTMLTVIHRRRLVIGLPAFVGRIMGALFGFGRAVSLGLLPVPVSSDQVKTLGIDNVVSGDHAGFEDLGITPSAIDAILPDYLWCYRPSGQYAEIKASAKNLKA